MKKLNRRNFIKVTGAGSLAAAAAVGATTALIAGSAKPDTLTFRAVAGLPVKPLPNYASLVIEGHIDLTQRSGVLTKTVFAGSPQMMSAMALPGMSRIVHITDVQEKQGLLYLTGVVSDRSLLARGESPALQMSIDRSNHTASVDFFGSQFSLLLER